MNAKASSSVPAPALLRLRLASPAATHNLGRALGAAASAGQVLALSGDLGAGKTTLAQGIAAGLGITAAVTSPTFTLVNEYDAGNRGLRLVHIDVYRLGETTAATVAAVAGIGLEDILVDAALPDRDDRGAVVVIEWAERIAPALPDDHLHIRLSDDPEDPDDADARRADLQATGEQSRALLAALT